MRLNKLKELNSSIVEHFKTNEEFSMKGSWINQLSCLLQVALVIVAVPMVFETNDDVIMNAIAAGAITGSHSEYLLFSNIAIGQFLTWCYSHFPTVNWYTWYLVAAFVLGYGAIQHVFFRLNAPNWVRIVRHILIFSVIIHALFILQFTRIAAVVAAGGFLVILFSQRQTLLSVLIGGFLIVLASAIRYPVFVMFILLSLPFVLFILLNGGWRRLVWLSLVCAGAFLLNVYHNQSYSSNPQMQEYMAFNTIRSGVTTNDSPQFNYLDKKPVADELGWSENDFMLISNFNLDVGFEKFSPDKLEQALAYDVTDSTDGSFLYLSTHTLKASIVKFSEFLFSPQNSAMLALMFIVVLLQWKWFGRLAMVYLFYTVFLGFAVALFANGHLKPWVLFGMTLPFFLLLIYSFKPGVLLDKLKIPTAQLSRARNCLVIVVVVIALTPVMLHLFIMPRAINERIVRDAAVYEAIDSFKDPFYAGWTSITHYKLFELPYEKSNAYGMGWRAGSPWNKRLIENYTGQRDIGIFSIYDMPIVWYFRKADDLYFQDYEELVVTFYEENYPGCHIQREVIPVTKRDTLYRYTFLIDS